MDRFTHQNVKELINGYFFSKPCEAAEITFDRAKKELLSNLKSRIVDVEAFTYADWMAKKF